MAIMIKVRKTDDVQRKLKTCRLPALFVYFCVTKQICTQDTQCVPSKQRPAMAGHQRNNGFWKLSETATHISYLSAIKR